MPRMFIPPPGAAFPATLADMRKCKAGQRDKAKIVYAEAGKAIPAPYPEIVSSWLANGFTEVGEA